MYLIATQIQMIFCGYIFTSEYHIYTNTNYSSNKPNGNVAY